MWHKDPCNLQMEWVILQPGRWQANTNYLISDFVESCHPTNGKIYKIANHLVLPTPSLRHLDSVATYSQSCQDVHRINSESHLSWSSRAWNSLSMRDVFSRGTQVHGADACVFRDAWKDVPHGLHGAVRRPVIQFQSLRGSFCVARNLEVFLNVQSEAP